MHLAVRRLSPPLLALALAVACNALDGPERVDIPEGASIYKLAPTIMSYEGVDSTQGGHFAFTWLAGETFFGTNCLAFSPTPAASTSGSFVFFWTGENSGRVERRSSGAVLDTVQGFFMAVDEPGTHGTYDVNASGALTLNWANGSRNRYFDPTATLRLSGDTVESVADLRARGDSIRDQWHVYWITSPSCP